MSSDSRGALRVGILDALRAAGGVTSLVAADRIKTGSNPAGAEMPYIRLGSAEGAAFEAKTDLDGLAGRFEVHCWCTSVGGSDGVEPVQRAIDEALKIGAITLAGHSLTVWTLDFCDWFPEPGGDTYHGVQRYRFLTCGA